MTKVGDYVVDFFAKKGVDKIFLVYGAANGDLVDAFVRVEGTEYVAMMHEQACGFAAEGYAKVRGLPGVAIATSGPGGQNFITPIGNCYYDSVSAIFITGQIKQEFMRPDESIRQIGFQETDIVSIAKPITKYAVMISDPDMVRFELERAWHLCTTGRPGPVLIDIPMDIQKAFIDPESLAGFDVVENSAVNSAALEEDLKALLDDISNSKRPAILCGAGVRSADAIHELEAVASKLKIPVFATWNALDVVTSDMECYGGRVGTYGGSGRNFGIQNCDLLIAVGSRISGRITGGNVKTFAREAKKYLVDIDKPMLQKAWQQVPFDVNIYADAKEFLGGLCALVDSESWAPEESHLEWFDTVMNWKTKYDPVQPHHHFGVDGRPHPYSFMRKLSEAMPSNAVIVGDCGGNIVVSNHAFETKRGQRMFSNNGNSPMGFSFAGGLGACVATTNPVICTIGDGGFNMNLQELQTLLNYNIPLKTFILNNHIYGITKAYQETNFEGRCEACGPVGYNPPDFRKIVEAYGIKVFCIDNVEDVDSVIESVLSYQGPVVCDVNIHEHHTYEPRIFGWSTPIEDMYPYLPRDEFANNMIIQPLDGWDNPIQPPSGME